VLADTLNRKRLISITHTCNFLPGLALGMLTVTGHVQIWHVNTLNVIASQYKCWAAPRAKR